MSVPDNAMEELKTAIREAFKTPGYSDEALANRLRKTITGLDKLTTIDVALTRKEMGLAIPRGRRAGMSPKKKFKEPKIRWRQKGKRTKPAVIEDDAPAETEKVGVGDRVSLSDALVAFKSATESMETVKEFMAQLESMF